MTPESFPNSNGEQSSRKEPFQFNVERILIAGNRGPCGGVAAALDAAFLLSEQTGTPVRTNNDVVHNNPIMDELKERDFINVGEDWRGLERSTRFIWSAHGHTEEDERIAAELGLDEYDTTCPLVTRVQLGVKRADERNHFVVYIGKDGHPETRSVMSRARPENRVLVQDEEDVKRIFLPNDRLSEVFSQTTLMADKVTEIEEELAKRWPGIIIHKKKDLCDATLNRQEAVKLMAPRIDMLFVVGSPHSDNSNAMREVGVRAGVKRSYIFDYPHQIQTEWFTSSVKVVGITSGASVLDRFMLPVVDWLKERNPNLEVVFDAPIRDEYTDPFKLPPKTEAKLKQFRK